MTGDLGELVAAAVAGQSLGRIAAAAGMSVSTVQRRLAEPEVVALVNEARAQRRQEALGQLSGLRASALERLAGLLDSDDPSIVLRTAALVISTSTALDKLVDHDQRLAALEAQDSTSTFGSVREEVHDDDPVD
jgi:hypothetical protein